MQSFPNQNFRFGIFAAYTGHAMVALQLCQLIRHNIIEFTFESLPLYFEIISKKPIFGRTLA